MTRGPHPDNSDSEGMMNMPATSTVCVIVGSWPRVSTTFIAQELVGLESEGLRLRMVALRDRGDIRHALHDQIAAPVHYLPRRPLHQPLRMWRAWSKVRRLPGYARTRAVFRQELKRGALPRRVRLFMSAVILAAELPPEVRMIYVHFIAKPGTVARYVALMTGLPLAGSAHARDIWTTPEQEKREKLAAMRWITTCNGPAAADLRACTEVPEKVHLIYHGLSLKRFPELPPARSSRDGRNAGDPVRLLSVGRAVEKKGFDILLEALAQLDPDLHWHWDHIGAGELLDELKAQAAKLGLNNRITWHGAQNQSVVINQYRDCDLFVFPAKEASDGDRDGLPNVLMEAQSQALACLSTRFTAIPELIEHGETGVLVPPGDVGALASAIEMLARSPGRRHEIGMAGYSRVRRDFQAEDGIRQIAAMLREAMVDEAT